MDKITKQKNFKRVAEKRVSEVIEKICSLRNLTNSSFYAYSSKDIEQIIESIEKELYETSLVLRGIKENKVFKL